MKTALYLAKCWASYPLSERRIHGLNIRCNRQIDPFPKFRVNQLVA
jgi:hypothetical protein